MYGLRKTIGFFALIAVLFGIGYVSAQYSHQVVVPLYAAGYAPASADPTDDPPAAGGFTEKDRERLRKIEDKLDQLIKLATEDDVPDPTTTPPAGSAPNPLRSAAVKCAGCHHADVFETKGGGFQLFLPNGNFKKLEERDRKRLVLKVGNGTMPPPEKGKLSDPEKAAMIAAFPESIATKAPTVPKK